MEQSATQTTKRNLGEYITPSLYTRNMHLQIEQLIDSFSKIKFTNLEALRYNILYVVIDEEPSDF